MTHRGPFQPLPLCDSVKILNRAVCSLDPWGALLLAGLQLCFVPLITILWAWSFSSIFKPPCCLLIQPSHQQLLFQDLMGDSVKGLGVKGLTEVQVDTIHCSPLVY